MLLPVAEGLPRLRWEAAARQAQGGTTSLGPPLSPLQVCAGGASGSTGGPGGPIVLPGPLVNAFFLRELAGAAALPVGSPLPAANAWSVPCR
eukprot:15607877-Heterocapsa_arctica.AAC.1